MKKFYLVLLFIQIWFTAYSAKVTITNSGTTFSPNAVTIKVGDTVVFVLSSSHNAIEVSQSTYTANGNTSNGGFSLPFGGGSVNFAQAGIYYFVCEPHAHLGMKGIITVNQTAGVANLEVKTFNSLYPNPMHDFVYASFYLKSKSAVVYTIMELNGKEIFKEVNIYDKPGEVIEYLHPDKALSKGIYVLQAKMDDGTIINGKIIRQ